MALHQRSVSATDDKEANCLATEVYYKLLWHSWSVYQISSTPSHHVAFGEENTSKTSFIDFVTSSPTTAPDFSSHIKQIIVEVHDSKSTVFHLYNAMPFQLIT